MTRADKIAQQFEVEEIDDGGELPPRYNIAPAQQVAIIRQHHDHPGRRLSSARWGLVPFWSKDPNIGYKMINARAETIAEKPAFREAFRTRRCLIPADGFYEWKKEGKTKQPFSFTMIDDSIFAFAGIWERWKDPKGTIVETCSILTTAANALLADMHDRMPVIVSPEDYELWLDPGFKNPDGLIDILKPYDPRLMKRYPVSTRVNLVKNDDPECAAEVKAAGA